jgi:hypothetical protein
VGYHGQFADAGLVAFEGGYFLGGVGVVDADEAVLAADSYEIACDLNSAQ